MARTTAREKRKAIAYKAFGLCEHLTASDIRVATIIVDHCNLKSGRCDPGLQRLALLAGVDERTVRRAVNKLAGGNKLPDGTHEHPVLIKRISHGGHFYAARYIPDFEVCEAIVSAYDRKAAGLRSDRSDRTDCSSGS